MLYCKTLTVNKTYLEVNFLQMFRVEMIKVIY